MTCEAEGTEMAFHYSLLEVQTWKAPHVPGAFFLLFFPCPLHSSNRETWDLRRIG